MPVEYGSMMRHLVDTECRQLHELQNTHIQYTAREVAKRTGEAGRKNIGGSKVSPVFDTKPHAYAHNKPSAVEKREGLWL